MGEHTWPSREDTSSLPLIFPWVYTLDSLPPRPHLLLVAQLPSFGNLQPWPPVGFESNCS